MRKDQGVKRGILNITAEFFDIDGELPAVTL
jgi:hypothetical protein